MGYFVFSAIFLCFVAGATAGTQKKLTIPKFLVGKNHLYDITFNMTAGIPGMHSQRAKACFKATLNIWAETKTKLVLMIRDVKTIPTEPAVDSEEEFVTLNNNRSSVENLQIPFKCHYEKGKVRSYTLDPKDTLETQKIKRAILRLLEVDLPKKVLEPPLKVDWPATYNVTRVSAFGNYSSHYVITSSPYEEFPKEFNVFNITSTHNYEDIPYNAYKIHHNFVNQGCPAVCKGRQKENKYGAGCPLGYEPHQSAMKRSFTQNHNLRYVQEDTLIIDSVKTTETHFADVYDQQMVVKITIYLAFKVATMEKITERRGQYNYANLDDFSNEINEEGIAKFCGYSNKNVTAIINLLHEVAEIVVKADIGNKTTNILGEKVFLLRSALMTLKQIDFRHIQSSIVSYHNMPKATEIEQVKRQIWLDILPVIGTVDAVAFITNIIQENVNKPDKEISAWEAASVLSALPPNLIQLTERIISDLIRLLDLVSEREQPGYIVFYSASYLAVAGTIYEACAVKSPNPEIEKPPKKTVMDDINIILQHLTNTKHGEHPTKCPKPIVNRFMDDLASKMTETEDNAKRVIYIQALARMGLPEVLPYLLPYLYGKLSDFSPSYGDFLKVVTIRSLHNFIDGHPRDVQHLVMPIYLNRTESAKVRIAAFSVFIKTNPSLGILQQIAEKTWEETSLEVGSFVTSTLDHLADSSLPCLQLISHRIQLVIPHTKRFDIGIHHSKNFWFDFFDEKREFGVSQQMMYAASNESIIPSILYGHFGFHERHLNEYLFQCAITSQGLNANTILDHFYKLFGFETADSIPKRKESEIFSKAKIVPRDPEFWRMTMYQKMFYSESFNYFDDKEIQMGAVDHFVRDFVHHYITRDPKEGMKIHLVKLFIPASYHMEAIGQAWPYPIQSKRENVVLLSLKWKIKQENHTPSKKVKVLFQPSSYFSTLYTTEILNLRDCKRVGAYHTSNTASSHSIELELTKNGTGNFNLTFRFPNLSNQTFDYNSEAGTHTGEHSSNDLLDMKHRIPIRTIPLRFKKSKIRNFPGMPPTMHEVLTENILEVEEEKPKGFRNSIMLFFEKYRNAGWKRRTENVTQLPIKDEWSSNTTCSLVFEFNRQYPPKPTKHSRKLKDINDEIKRPCYGKFMTETNDTFFEEIERVRNAFKTDDHMLHDNIKIYYQQKENKKIVSTSEISFSYNRTLSGKMHDSELNITSKTYNMSKPFKISMGFTALENGKAHMLNYNHRSYDDQRGLALFRLEFGENGPYPNFTLNVRGMYKQKPPGTIMKTELEAPISPDLLLPETHYSCLEDKKKGNGYSIACMKAIEQRSRFNTLSGVISWKEKLPQFFKQYINEAAVFLKTDFSDAMQKKDSYLRYNVTYIDVLTDKSIYELFLENYNDTVRKAVPALLPPHYSTASLFDSFTLKATNNAYPSTCVVMEKYVTTFDMVNYPLSGDVHTCSYVVSTHCVKQKKFAVTAKFNVATPGFKDVDINIGKDLVKLTPQNKSGVYTVKYNGQEHEVVPLMPVPLNNKTLIFAYIFDVDPGILVVEAITTGIKAIYDGKNIFLQVSSKYKGELCGLCSDFNGETLREFHGMDGCLYTDGGDFAKSSTLGHCIDKTPSNSYICPGHKFSAGSSEPDLNDIPEVEINEEVKEEEAKIEMRNKVISIGDKLCFSLQALPICEGDLQPTETEEVDVGFVCYLKNDPKTKHMLAETSYRILSELEIEDCDFTQNITVAKRC